MINFNSLPVAAPLRITSKYGKRNTGIQGASTYHKGIDLGRDFNKPETAILAVAPGRIISNYWNNTRGWVVVIDHGGYKTLSQHMKAQCPLPVGTEVKAGQQIGIMGASTKTIKGMAMHLHFELITGAGNVDPEPYLRTIKPISNTEESEEDEMKRYNSIAELPKALQKEAQELMEAGALAGSDGKLDVTEDMIRAAIISKRYIDQAVKGGK